MISDRRLHVGLVSGDFRWHSVAFFLLALLRHLDRERLELTCFSNFPESDEMTAILREHADAWVDIHEQSDAVVLQRMRRSRIDVLVDLSGHTAYNRMVVFAQRAAPLQLSWLGYPGPTANPGIDYWMTDPCICPPAAGYPWVGSRPLWLEPGCHAYHAPMEERELPLVGESAQEPRPDAGKRLWLGSFNHRAKLSRETLRMWADVLNAAPATGLLLKSRCYGEAETRVQLLKEFACLGVESNRVELWSRTPSTREHLEMYRRLDIALDTYPYAGTTTTLESLWMGVPVVTRCGRSPSSRVGASILKQLGEPGWVTSDRRGFTRAVLDLIEDAPKRRQFRLHARARLRAQGLTDGERFARAWEAAIQSAWCDTVQRFDPGHFGTDSGMSR